MCILITTEDGVILKKSCKGATSLTTVGVRFNTRFSERYRSLMDYESEVKLYMKKTEIPGNFVVNTNDNFNCV